MKRFSHGKVPNANRPKGARNKISRANLEKRRVEAKTRQADTDKQTPQQRLAALDAKLGIGVGAVKERARLASYIKNPQLRFKVTVNVAQAKEQLQKVTSAVKQFNRELKKVKVVNQRNPAAAPGVPNLPPLSTVVARVG